jgi:hypothetical protein
VPENGNQNGTRVHSSTRRAERPPGKYWCALTDVYSFGHVRRSIDAAELFKDCQPALRGSKRAWPPSARIRHQGGRLGRSPWPGAFDDPNSSLVVGPLHASDAELAYYNFPPRPTDAAGLQSWSDEWSHYSRTLPPSFCVADAASSVAGVGGLFDSSDSLGDGETTYSYKNWSGVFAGQRANPFTYVYGTIDVPTQTVCAGTQHSDHSKWVGIGGAAGDTHLLQNGIVQFGSPMQTLAWWEGLNASYDSRQTYVSGFSVSTGDTLNIATQYDTSTNRVTFNFHNLTTGVAANPSMTAMNVIRKSDNASTIAAVSNFFSGTSAEAIDERDYSYTDGKLNQLRQFSTSHWTNVSAATGGLTTRTNLRSLYPHSGVMMYTGTSSANRIATVKGGTTADAFTDTWNGCGVQEN